LRHYAGVEGFSVTSAGARGRKGARSPVGRRTAGAGVEVVCLAYEPLRTFVTFDCGGAVRLISLSKSPALPGVPRMPGGVLGARSASSRVTLGNGF